MTCVVAVAGNGRVLLGADSLISAGTEAWPAGQPKVWVAGAGRYGIGFAGELAWGDFLRYHVRWPTKTNELPRRLTECVKRAASRRNLDLKKASGSALICHAGVIYNLDTFLTCMPEVRGYAAIGEPDLAHGSLSTTASLSMSPKKRAVLALKAAAEHSKNVRKPWVWVKV